MKGHSSLDVFDFGLLLQALAQSLKVGTLRVLSGTREKYIYLDRGRVEAIYTPRTRYRIGRLLYNMGAVEMEDLKIALREQQKANCEKPLGEYLLSRGMVTEEDLREALAQQMIEEVLEIFYWKDIAYEFLAGPPEQALRDRDVDFRPIVAPQDCGTLLLSVTKIIDDVEKFHQVLPSSKDVYDISKDPEPYLVGLERADTVRSLLSLVDGQRDMGEVLQDMRLNRFEVMELLYYLRTEEIIRPKNSFELLMLAENRRSQISPLKRSRLYERVSELGVDGFDISLLMAEVYEELQQYDKAALKYAEHAEQMEKEGDLETAERSASRALKVAPDSIDIRWFRTGVLRRLERDDDLVEELLEIVKIHRRRGETAKAEPALVAALEVRPRDERLHLQRINLLKDVGASRRAANACRHLARRREQSGNLEGTAEALRAGLEAAPHSIKLRHELVRVLALMEDSKGAAQVLEEAVSHLMRRAKKRPERALRILDFLSGKIDEFGIQESRAAMSVAEAYLNEGERDKGLELLKTCGEARIAGKLWPGARDAFARACQVAPEDLDLAETLALVHAKLGNRENALARLRSIAGIYFKRGKKDRAEKAYNEMLRLNPFSPDALLELARLKSSEGQRKEAAERLHQIGLLYGTMGNIEDATEYLDEACRLDPSQPMYVRSLAESLSRVLKTKNSLEPFDAILTMLRARNDHIGAIDVAFKVLALDPDHALARETLKETYAALGKKVKTAFRPKTKEIKVPSREELLAAKQSSSEG